MESVALLCRRRFSAAVKATCLSFGHGFTLGLVQPLFAASAALPDQDGPAHEAGRIIEVSAMAHATHGHASRHSVSCLTPLMVMSSAMHGQILGIKHSNV